MSKKLLLVKVKDYPFEIEVPDVSVLQDVYAIFEDRSFLEEPTWHGICFDKPSTEELSRYFFYPFFYRNAVFGNLAFIGPKKYMLTEQFLEQAADIYKLPVNCNDTFVVTYPKSGTTLTQDLVWLLCNDLDYEKAKSVNLNERFPFLEITSMFPVNNMPYAEDQKEKLRKSQMPITLDELKQMPSPRYIKSHLPLSLLPPLLVDTAKVVYVARDPRDVALSFYKFHKFLRMISPDKEFKDYWKLFISNKIFWSPVFEHVLEAWEKRSHPNMLFLFYEDMIRDLPAAIRRVADFYGKTLSDEQVEGLTQHLNIDNFKKNKSVNMEDLVEAGIYRSDGAFIRKGKSGGWRDYFDEEMTAQADEWIATQLRDTDFRLPNY